MPESRRTTKARDTSGRSPIKKHLRNAAIQNLPIENPSPLKQAAPALHAQSPQKLKSNIAKYQTLSTDSLQDDMIVTGESTQDTTTNKTAHEQTQVRVSMLQTLLSLMDCEDHVLQAILPLLQSLCKIPTENSALRNEYIEILQELNTRFMREHEHKKLISFGMGSSRRDSGRAKSSVNLQHCKDFLLACANEIHELEEISPCFDYVETCSDTSECRIKSDQAMQSHRALSKDLATVKRGQREPLSSMFDYMSSVETCSSVATGINNISSIQQSPPRIRQRISYLSPCVPRIPQKKSLHDRQLCRRVFEIWRNNHSIKITSSSDIARKYHAFEVLKRERAMSLKSRQLKQFVFLQMKEFIRVNKHSRTTAPINITTAATSFIERHWIALFFVLAVIFANLLELAF